MELTYLPQVGHLVRIVLRYKPYLEPVEGQVVGIVQANEVPDADLMGRLFDRNLLYRDGDRAGLGIPAKPSRYVRIVCHNKYGRAFTVTLDSSRIVTFIGELKPNLRLVKS